MAYNFKSKYHVSWPTTFGHEALHQDSWNVGAALRGEAECVLCPSYSWVFFLSVSPKRFHYIKVHGWQLLLSMAFGEELCLWQVN